MGIRRSPTWLTSFSPVFVKYEIFQDLLHWLSLSFLPRLFQTHLHCQILKLIFLFVCLFVWFHVCFRLEPQVARFSDTVQAILSPFVKGIFLYRLPPCALYMDHRTRKKITSLCIYQPSLFTCYNEDREDWSSTPSPAVINVFKKVKFVSNNQPQILTLWLRPS